MTKRLDNRWFALALAAAMVAGPAVVRAEDSSSDTGAAAEGAADSEVTNPEPSSPSAGGIDQDSTGSTDESAAAETDSSATEDTGSEATSGMGTEGASGTGAEGASESEVTNPEPPSSESAGGIDPSQEDAGDTGSSAGTSSDSAE